MDNLGGRPTIYSIELAIRICTAVSTTPRGLEHICKDNPDFPVPSTIYKWELENTEFEKMFMRAQENRGMLIFDECLDIADDTKSDTKTIKHGGTEFDICDKEWVLRSKLRVDTRLRMAAQLHPRKLRPGTVVAGDPNAPLGTVTLPAQVPAGTPPPPLPPIPTDEAKT